MAYLYEMNPRSYAELLAADKIAVPDPEAPGVHGLFRPDDNKRTILIGLGGMGVKTIDQVKGEIMKKFTPDWRAFVAFLGVDSDWEDLRRCKYLTPSETFCITKPRMNQAAANPMFWPQAWRATASPEQVHGMDFDLPGASGKRLMGKLKLHSSAPHGAPTDVEFAQKLRELVCHKLAPPVPAAPYDVYIVGGLSGGTGSGCFMDMPALVRHALSAVHPVRIHGIGYLPDVIAERLPAPTRQRLNANGHAALKELNYYMGLAQRQGYPESFPCNHPAHPELQLNGNTGFFDRVWLVGDPSNGTSPDPQRRAMGMVTDHLSAVPGPLEGAMPFPLSLDAHLDGAMIHAADRELDPTNPDLEAPGSDHAFPKRFGALGSATAAVPEELPRACLISEACKKAGIAPVSPEEYAALAAAGAPMLPFMGEDQYLPAAQLTQQAQQLLQPLTTLLGRFFQPVFRYEQFFGAAPNWKEIRDNPGYLSEHMCRVAPFIEEHTSPAAICAMEGQVQEAFRAFRNAAEQYVTQYGPYAFVNLFNSNGIPNGDERAIGIREALHHAANGCSPRTGNPIPVPHPEEAHRLLMEATDVIYHTPGGLIAQMQYAINAGHYRQQVYNWMSAFDATVNARIFEGLGKALFGSGGILNRCFLEPAQLLCQQLYAYGKILETMAACYADHSAPLRSFWQHQDRDTGPNRLDPSALFAQSHTYLGAQIDQAVQLINGANLRSTLVHSFFADPDQWLQVGREQIQPYPNGDVRLRDPDCPVAARRAFDRCMDQQLPVLHFSMAQMMENAQLAGVPCNQFAMTMLAPLAHQSQPLLNAAVHGNESLHVVIYPREVHLGFHTMEVDIMAAAAQLFGPNVLFYLSDDDTAVTVLQMALPFELYRLHNLPEWERAYEHAVTIPSSGIHGYSPDICRTYTGNVCTCTERTPWRDYPGIVYRANPKEPDPNTGLVCHEGQVRMAMDHILDEARRKGILYAAQEPGGQNVIRRIHLGPDVDWQFDPDALTPDPETGLFPEDQALLEQIARLHNRHPADITRTVRLEESGLLSRSHPTEELAWEYARRVLYVHRPMFLELRRTLELTAPWFDAVQERNEQRIDPFPSPKMLRLMHAHMLYPDKENTWFLTAANGRPVPIASASGMDLYPLRFQDPYGQALLDAGLTLFFVYRQLTNYLTPDRLNAVFQRANQILAEREDPKLLDDCRSRTQVQLNKELYRLETLGADPKNLSLDSSRFRRSMKDLDLGNAELLEELCRFYSKAGRWESM